VSGGLVNGESDVSPPAVREGGPLAKRRHEHANILLRVNSIEVIYNHVILVLKGVSFSVPEGGVVALLGGNGAGKTTTLRAVSNLLHGERGEVTKGTIELRDERIEALTPAELVKRGVIQVMEGRHCFGHLSIEENLLTGAYTRKRWQGGYRRDARQGLRVFSTPEDAPQQPGGLYLGRRATDVRRRAGADGQSEHGAARRAVDGLAPQIVDEVFGIVKDLNQKEGVTFLLAEQNTNMALRYADFGYILENGRVVMEGAAKRSGGQRRRQGVLPGTVVGGRKSFRDVKHYRRRKRWLS
jgi:branched-chain amino acid transport system ATP-binding protein